MGSNEHNSEQATNLTLSSDVQLDQSEKNEFIRYQVEYRHPITNELVSKRTASGLHDQTLENNQQEPIFEVVTTYKARTSRSTGPETRADQDEPRSMGISSPSYHINIYSPAIINALRSVVKYYPSQDLAGDPIVVTWPYPVLVHHYEELNEFKDECATKDAESLCIREQDAPSHIAHLLAFLDEHVMKDVRAEQERNEKGFDTWEYLWVAYKPGRLLISKSIEDREPSTHAIHSVEGGTFETPRAPWSIQSWSLMFDGTYVGRVYKRNEYPSYDGEETTGLFVEVDRLKEHGTNDLVEDAKQQYDNGERYWNSLRPQCMFHRGKTEEFPYREVEGLVMSDSKTYFADWPRKKPTIMERSDLRNWTSDCSCPVCKKQKKEGRSVEALFEDCECITLESTEELTPLQYMLLPHSLPAFVFATRSWELLHVKNLSEPNFPENMIQNLVLEPRRKETLIALSSSFARRNKQGEKLSRDMWAADFVKGKGSGLIFLLHGQPGVGKTYTAECIAAFTKRPLMTLTSSDIGTDPESIEWRLTNKFRTAKSWGAILLIDEADVFMERRTSSDLVRNSLVAGFLRALEYYDGILFLTTNRVGAFDDAFISRVHIQLYYDRFNEDDRRKVWQTFVDKLADDCGNYIRLNAEAKEYIYSREVCNNDWNGREIRNAFQTAVALAEYQSRKDEEGTILVTDAHFRPVMELSRDFRTYMNDLHRGNLGKRAERNYERLDS